MDSLLPEHERLFVIKDLLERRHSTMLAERLKGANERERAAIKAEENNCRRFQLKLETDYAFFKHVQEKVTKLDLWNKHIDELTMLVLLEITASEQPTLHDAEAVEKDTTRARRRAGDVQPLSYYNPKTRARIMERYGELFLEPSRSSCSGDRRRKPFATLFSRTEMPPEYDIFREVMIIDRARSMLLSDSNSPNTFSAEAIAEYELLHRLCSVDPECIAHRDRFVSHFNATLDRIETSHPSVEREAAIRALRTDEVRINGIRFLLEEEVALGWFRERTLASQNKILNHKAPFKLTREFALRSVEASRRCYGEDILSEPINTAADAFCYIGEDDYAILLLDELSKMERLPSREKATCCHHMGIIKLGKTPKKAIGDFRRAICICAGDEPLKAAACHHAVAVAQHRLGHKDRSKASFEEAKKAIGRAEAHPMDKIESLLRLAQAMESIGLCDEELETLEAASDVAGEISDSKYLLFVTQSILDTLCGCCWSNAFPGYKRIRDPFVLDYAAELLSTMRQVAAGAIQPLHSPVGL